MPLGSAAARGMQESSGSAVKKQIEATIVHGTVTH
jgi:hypothetical protein